MDIQYPLPDGLNLRSSLGSFPAGKFLCHAAPPLRAAHFFADFIDEEDKLQGEEDVRLDLLIGEYAPADFEDSDGGGPALWSALCGASPALARVADLARQLALEVQSQLEAASAGQRVWPIGIQIPHAGAKKAAQQGFYELSFIAFALERPVEIAGDLVTLVAAAGRLPCARRGSNASRRASPSSSSCGRRPGPCSRQRSGVCSGSRQPRTQRRRRGSRGARLPRASRGGPAAGVATRSETYETGRRSVARRFSRALSPAQSFLPARVFCRRSSLTSRSRGGGIQGRESSPHRFTHGSTRDGAPGGTVCAERSTPYIQTCVPASVRKAFNHLGSEFRPEFNLVTGTYVGINGGRNILELKPLVWWVAVGQFCSQSCFFTRPLE